MKCEWFVCGYLLADKISIKYKCLCLYTKELITQHCWENKRDSMYNIHVWNIISSIFTNIEMTRTVLLWKCDNSG